MNNLFRNKYLIPSIRLSGYDYSQAGYYFVTICTQNRYHYFGNITDEKMNLNEVGKTVNQYWLEIPKHFSHVILDEFVIMPNHVHGIIIIDDVSGDDMVKTQNGYDVGCRDVACNRSVKTQNGYDVGCRDVACNVSTSDDIENFMSKISPKSSSLSTIIRSFKSAVTKTINQKYGNNYFIWQPRFYDHIIRNEMAYHNIRQYIINNPMMWNRDRNHGENLLM